MPRFVVRSVRGYLITPSASAGGGRTAMPVSWLVLDSAIGYRLMAEFSPSSTGGRNTSEGRKLYAEAYAAKLEHECRLAEAGRAA